MSSSTLAGVLGDGAIEPPASRPRVLSLQTIQKPVAEELSIFQEHFRNSMYSQVGLLDKIIRYVLRQKGKRIRPVLVLLSAAACGSINEKTYRAATLVELLHTATLIHDDVVDDAERRRGVFSINALWKNKVAVLLGDFLLSRGLLLAVEHNDLKLLGTLSHAVRRMSEGELLQIEKSRRLDLDEETYFRIISDKTASLIAACTASGTMSVTDDEALVERMRTMGEKLGMAFQIRDDLFDFGVDDVGKPLGIDLQEKKLTLPLIFGLRQTDASERKRILRIVQKKVNSRADVREVSRFVESTGGIRYAREVMNRYAGEARLLLQDLPPSDARQGLIDLVDYTVTRKK